MTPARAATYLVGAVLLAAWLASAAGVVRSQIPPVYRAAADSTRLDAVVLDVQSQASRLRQRLAHAPAPRAALRNPFSFNTRRTLSAPKQARSTVAVAPAVDAAVPEPALMLIGIAEEGATRTAMVESGEELLMATEGQVLAGRYRVGKVGLDAVELVDVVSGATRRLVLRSPALLP
jgi:Tfp pilus assembly protein PilP